MRSALVTAVVAVAGLVAASTFSASLHRLEASPARWGWSGDVVVVDTTPAVTAELVADPRTDAVGIIESSTITLAGRPATAWAMAPAEGSMGFTTSTGRLPSSAGEVALGDKLARRLGVEVGDTVTATDPDGSARPLVVVGRAVVPTLSGNRLGTDVVVAPEVLEELGGTLAFTEAMVRTAPGVDVDAYAEELGATYELVTRSAPPEVANLADLGALPYVLGGFLAAVGAAALLNAVVVTVRRRSGGLAVLRAMGFTPGQVATAVVGAALLTVALGVVVGVPLGLSVGRLVWWVAAADAGVAPDPSWPWGWVVIVVPGALLAAALVAVGPAWSAARLRPGPLLRAE